MLLFAIAVIFGVVVMPALRRRRERQDLERAAATADAMTRRPGPVSFDKADHAGHVDTGHEGGLVPADQLDVRLPGPDDDLIAALEETQRTQDWRPVGKLLALTDEPELRWQRVQSLAGAASLELARHRATGQGTDAGWLRMWRAQEPEEAGGAELYAQFLVWEALRDGAAGERRVILEEAAAVCAEASRLAPADDPVPGIVNLYAARGLGGRQDFDALWAGLAARAPQHMGAHIAAISYLSEQWHGSRADAEGFARAAAGAAGPGSLLPALPLFAVYNHLPDMQHSPGMFQGAVIRDAIEGAQFALNAAPADHPMAPHVRHLLLWFLVRAERYPEAAEQVRAVDGYVGAMPWVAGGEPVREYTAFRALAIARQ
ncbi:hypothetical protein [Streptomyces sp. NPDC049881]|uniref:hypothetical protein n=1 Tax=Streptomyces sp. NPDC049881 TaxID=3155778 RepID=UPI003440D3A4